MGSDTADPDIRQPHGIERHATRQRGHVLVILEAPDDRPDLVAHADAIARSMHRHVRLIRRLETHSGSGLPIDPVEQDLRRLAAEVHLDQIATACSVHGVAPTRQVCDQLTPQALLQPNEPAPILVFGMERGELPWQHDSDLRSIVERHCEAVLLVAGRRPTSIPLRYRSVALLLDGSRSAESALPLGVAIARNHAAELLLLHAAFEPTLLPAETQDAEAVELQRRIRDRNARVGGEYLEKVRARQCGPGLHLATRLIDGQDPKRELLRAVREEGVDLIVIASHGESSNDDVSTGSVARYVLEHAPVPVLMAARRIASSGEDRHAKAIRGRLHGIGGVPMAQ